MTAHNPRHPLYCERGFLSLEVIIVLVVLLALLAGIASRTGDLFAANDTANAASQLTSLQTNIDSLKTSAGFGDDGTDLAAALIQTKTVPAGLAISGTTIMDNWGKPLTIVSLNSGQAYSIKFQQVPATTATQLITKFLDSGVFVSIKVNSTSLSAPVKLQSIADAIGGNSQVSMEFIAGIMDPAGA